jgi:predicted amidohydrolase YtcJ
MMFYTVTLPKRTTLSLFLLTFRALAQGPATTVFHNGTIYTLDASNTKAEALAIANGTIVFVGTNDGVKPFIGSNTIVIDLQQRTAMPGFIDSHLHMGGGGAGLTGCDLNYEILSIDQVVDHVKVCLDAELDKINTEEWLSVTGWDPFGTASRSGHFTKASLDRLNTTRPIILSSVDFHSVFLNSKGLQLSNITAVTPDPPKGKITRIPGTREPNGLLQDDAMNLVSGGGGGRGGRGNNTDPLAATKAALRQLREAGVTTFQDAGTSSSDGYDELVRRDEMTARGFFNYLISPPDTVDGVKSLVQEVVNALPDRNNRTKLGPKPSLRTQAIKSFVDGVVNFPSNTAAMLEPYLDQVGNSTEWRPDNTSIIEPYWKANVINAMVEGLILNNVDLHLHVIGDAAVRRALDAMKVFRDKHPNITDYRVGLAHDEVMHPDDFPRFAEYGVDAILSFQWAQPGPLWLPYTFKALGEERTKYVEPYGDIARFGRPVTFGSDWPVSH